MSAPGPTFPPTSLPAAKPLSRLELVAVVAALLVTGWFYFFTVKSTDTLRSQGVNFDYYNLLVDGFRSGHLYLPIEPRPELLALPDPYEPSANSTLRLADASYFRGHYYIYFGVTPAIALMLPYTWATGLHLPQAAAVLIFCLTGFGAASALWLTVRRRFFPASAIWVGPTGVLLLGFGTQVLALARRPSIWELPIAANFAFLMLALLAVSRAVLGRRPVTSMTLAALCLGLAIGARPPALLAAGCLALGVWALRRQYRDRTWLRAAVMVGLVLAVIGAGLAWYNYGRFGSVTEFGQRYQLTGLNERHAHHFSPRFIGYNLRVYFTWPVQWTPEFPFIASRPLPPWPEGYFSGEELYCLALLSPVLWCAVAGLALWRRTSALVAPEFRTIVAATAAVFLPLFAILLCFFYAAERYMVDFVPTLMLLALWGVLLLERAIAGGTARRLVHGALALAAIVTLTSGVLASFDYHGRNMRETDPAAWNAIVKVVEPPVRAVIGGQPGHPRP